MTTHLQSILGERTDTRLLRFFESMSPITPEGLDQSQVGTWRDVRVLKIGFAEKLMRYLCPHFPYMFRIGWNLPSEDIDFGTPVFGTEIFESTAITPIYSKWFHSKDNTPAYKFHKLLFQYLQWQEKQANPNAPPKRWIMKTPQHAGQLRALLNVFPDAKVVLTHREPVAVLSSFVPMIITTLGFSHKNIRADKGCEYVIGQVETRLQHMVRDLKEIPTKYPQAKVLHIQFNDFIKNELKVALQVSEFAELNVKDEESTTKMKEYIAANARMGANIFTYRADTLGTWNESEIRRRFEFYVKEFIEPSVKKSSDAAADTKASSTTATTSKSESVQDKKEEVKSNTANATKSSDKAPEVVVANDEKKAATAANTATTVDVKTEKK